MAETCIEAIGFSTREDTHGSPKNIFYPLDNSRSLPLINLSNDTKPHSRMFRHFRNLHNIDRHRLDHIRRVIPDRSNPFEAMGEEEFLRRFRLTKECTLSLIQRIEHQLPQSLNNKGEHALYYVN